MTGLFVVGCFVTAIVAAACWLVVTGIREDQRSRAELEEKGMDQPVGL